MKDVTAAKIQEWLNDDRYSTDRYSLGQLDYLWELKCYIETMEAGECSPEMILSAINEKITFDAEFMHNLMKERKNNG